VEEVLIVARAECFWGVVVRSVMSGIELELDDVELEEDDEEGELEDEGELDEEDTLFLFPRT
jgi:hypothetical protein